MKKNRLLILVCLILTAYILFHKPISYYLIRHESKKYSIDKITTTDVQNNETSSGDFNFDSVSSISADQILLGSLETSKLPVIGYVAIPDVGIALPIFKGVGGNSMAYGAGTLTPEQKMGKGNYSLASHHVFGIEESEKMLFSPLEKVVVGQLIYLTDKKNVFIYKVTDILIVEPEQVDVLNEIPGKKVVTLVTCTDPEASQRLIVRGNLEDSREWKKADSQLFKIR